MPGALPAAPALDPLLCAAKTPEYLPAPGAQLPLPGRALAAGGVVAQALTYLNGAGSVENDGHPRRIPQPAPTTRRNEAGKTYTKNSDYVKGYKRDY